MKLLAYKNSVPFFGLPSIVLMYCAILLIYFELNACHNLFDVELTDFAVICAVIFVPKRVSKFMKCSYVVLLCCAILQNACHSWYNVFI